MAGIKGSQIGAMGGAGLGTVLGGPLGTAIGGGLGSIVGGLFDSDENTAPQMPPIVNPVTGEQLTQANANTQSGLAQQQAFVNALQAQNGIQNQSQVYGQFQDVAQGRGPNPALAALQQATGQNVANQAALAASQRGAGANAGLIARQAANQGSAVQQNAIGQAATLQAQQQLAALGNAGNIAGQQVGQQAGAIGNYNQFAQNNQGQLLGAVGNYNNAITGAQGNVNNNNQAIAGRGDAATGGLLNGIGGAAAAGGGGGLIGGLFSGSASPATDAQYKMPEMGATQLAQPTQGPSLGANLQFKADGGEIHGPKSFVGRHFMSQGGPVKAMLSPGEIYISPEQLKSSNPAASGKRVPGKANVKGDSRKNDTVPATLEEGGVVVPRTKANDPQAASKFVQAILSRKGLK